MLPSDTRGYATPATPNAQWSRPTLCGYQNQPCVPLGYQSGYLLPHPTWENPKPQFWHFEPWFPKVLEISENTLLYITAGSFGSGGGGGGGGRVFFKKIWFVGGEGFYIYLWCGGRGMRSDHHSYPSNGCNALWRWFVHENRGDSTPVTNWHRSPVASPTCPSPTPQNPHQTDWLTDGLAELIYKIRSWLMKPPNITYAHS